jgi:hypothetical protein
VITAAPVGGQQHTVPGTTGNACGNGGNASSPETGPRRGPGPTAMGGQRHCNGKHSSAAPGRVGVCTSEAVVKAKSGLQTPPTGVLALKAGPPPGAPRSDAQPPSGATVLP